MDPNASLPPNPPDAPFPPDSPQVWDRLIAAVHPPAILVSIAGRMGSELRRRTPLEDVWQETLLRAWQARAQFVWRDLPSFRQWLLRIAQSVIADLVDHATAQKRGGGREPIAFSSLGVASHGDGQSSSIYAGPAVSTTPSRVAADREQAAAMEQALLSLPDDLREVVRLRLFEGMTSEAVARSLGLGVSAVWHRFHKGAHLYHQRLRASGILQEG